MTLEFDRQAIQQQMQSQGHEALSIDDVCNEIFDMVRPKVEGRITFDDLIAW